MKFLNKLNSSNISVYDCPIIHLPKIYNRAGNITPIHGGINIPFEIRRIYYLYDIPGGETRGGHSHRECQQFIIAASGSFDITLDDGSNKKTINLNRPYNGIYVPAGIWDNLSNFSSGAICLVLTSHSYDEKDYIRNYSEFLETKKNVGVSKV